VDFKLLFVFYDFIHFPLSEIELQGYSCVKYSLKQIGGADVMATAGWPFL
jgi:hypothetical protein